MRMVVACILFVLALIPSAVAAPTLSSDDASKLLASVFDVTGTGISVGNLRIVNDGYGGAPDTVELRDLDTLQAWQAVGIVTVTRLPLPPPQLGGVLVTPTPLGLKMKVAGNEHNLTVRAGTSTVDRVVRVTPVTVRSDDFLVVEAVLTDHWEPFYSKFVDAPLPAKRRVKVLFKYDPFADSYDVVAFDAAPLNGKITTHNVDNALK